MISFFYFERREKSEKKDGKKEASKRQKKQFGEIEERSRGIAKRMRRRMRRWRRRMEGSSGIDVRSRRPEDRRMEELESLEKDKRRNL